MINGEGIYYRGDKALECCWYDDVRVEININDGDKDYVIAYIIVQIVMILFFVLLISTS